MKRLTLIPIIFALLCLSLYGQTHIHPFNTVSEFYETINGHVFAGEVQEYGSELWVTDGSAKGTFLLMDIYPGYYGSQPESFVECKGKVYFSANHPKYGRELWVTDGTIEGTMLFMDIQGNDAANKSSSNASPLFPFQDGFIFKADREANSSYVNIWFSDGTEEGSRILAYNEWNSKTVFPHNDSIFITQGNVLKRAHFDAMSQQEFNHGLGHFCTFSEGLFFATYTNYPSEIWLWFREANTGKLTELKKFAAGTYGDLEIDNVTKVGNSVFFSIRVDPNSGNQRDELWVCDIRSLELKLVKSFSWDWHTSRSYISNFKAVNNKLCFIGPGSSNHHLWVSDGSKVGPFELGSERIFKDVGLFADEDNENIYYLGSANWVDNGVYKSDGTKTGTTTVLETTFNVNGDSKICGLINDHLFFLAEKDDVSSLWSTQPAAELHVSKTFIDFWDVHVDSMAVGSIKIYNRGGSMLALSEVELVGQAFFLNDTMPNFIAAGDEISLNVIFFPVEKGLQKGSLRIKSNDRRPVFEIELEGNGIGDYKSVFSANADAVLRKTIQLQSEPFLIGLDNNQIAEENEPHVLVGNFVVNNNSGIYSDFQLVSGEGDTDNDEFSIEGNQIFANESFDFETHTTKLIRIKCVSADQKEYEQNLIIEITDQQETISTGDCQPYFEKLSYGLYDVAFNKSKGLFAVGEQGHLIRSLDFGHTWSDIELGYKGNLKRIIFASDEIGYILTDNNYLLKTEDGGEEWFLIELPKVDAYRYLKSFYFFNEDFGLVSDDDGYLYRTIDGGQTWSHQKYNYDGFSCFYFFNKNKGLAFSGNTFYTTEDGGENWVSDTSASFASGTRILSVSFADEQNGFIIDRSAQIYKTLDQGKTWFKSYKLPESYGQKIIFKDKDTGYAFGGGFMGNLFQTKDGGASWEHLNKLNYNETINGIAFNEASSICIVGSSGFGSTNAEGRTISTSDDGGQSWEKTCVFVHDDFYSKVLFPTEQLGYVTSTSLLYKTTNGGVTWNELLTKDELYEKTVIPLNKDTLVAYNQEALIRSFDGGVSWQTSKSIPEENPWSKHFNPDGRFFYVMQNRIIYSKDYGDTWQTANVNVSDFYVYYVDFRDEKVGFAFGDSWLKTTDGGENWNQVNGPEGYLHTQLCFASEQVIYAGGMNGLLSKTADGGQTWRTLQTGHTSRITDISFFNESEGYYSSTIGLFYTSDGGETWIRASSQNINSIAFTPGGTLYMACDDAQIIRLSKGGSPLSPGYIFGNNKVCTNEPQLYAMTTMDDTQVQWILPENTMSEVYGNKVVIKFPESGTYELSANLVNNCGTSSIKTITIEAGVENLLTIDGKTNVKEDETELNYTANGNSTSRYSWYVKEGTVAFQNGNSIDVTWESAGTGQVRVFEINSNQCRSYASLDVHIEPKTGFREDEAEQLLVYPNPVSSVLTVQLPLDLGPNSSLQFSTLSGNSLWHKNLNDGANTITINVNHLPSGVYLLELCSSTGNCVTKKIFVN
jgi:ELWxxDGT repeat protein